MNGLGIRSVHLKPDIGDCLHDIFSLSPPRVAFLAWGDSCFVLRGRDTHIDFLRLLFLVDLICPLMQEHFLSLLLKRKSLHCG